MRCFFMEVLYFMPTLYIFAQIFVLSTTVGNWNHPTVIADVLALHIIRDLDIDYLDFKPVIVYLNGEYRGIHTIRIDKDYFAGQIIYAEENITLEEQTKHSFK